MKIIKYKKGTKGLYKVELEDGRVLSLYEDVIIKYGILTKREVSDRDLVMILEENKNYECYYHGQRKCHSFLSWFKANCC